MFLRIACTCEETCESVWSPTQVSTQVQLASTCDYLPVRMARTLGQVGQALKQSEIFLSLLASHWQLNFFCVQRIKGNQIQKQIREEMDVLADQVTSLNTHRETQTQLVKKLEEREKALQNAVVSDKFMQAFSPIIHTKTLINADENGGFLKLFYFVFVETKTDTFKNSER